MTETGGYIPQDKIEEVRLAADVVEVIGRRVRLTRKGKDYWGLCPFHGDSDPSFKVDRARGTWYCFGCQEGGSVFSFLMKDEGLTFPEAVRELARRYGIRLPPPRRGPRARGQEEQRRRLLQALELAGKFFRQQLTSREGAAAREYLYRRRELEPQVVESFGLGYAPRAWEALGRFLRAQGVAPELAAQAGLLVPRERGRGHYDRFRGRVMFPIADATGRVVSFGGRILGEGEPKYLNGPESPVFAKGRTLYNLHRARRHIRRRDRALVVEGYFDVIACTAHGFAETVAPLGTALGPAQVRRLKGQAAEVVVVFDGDQAGLRAAERALGVFLAEGMPARVLLLPQGHDPDTFLRQQGAEAFARLVDEARPLVEVVLERMVEQGESATPEGRSRILGRAAEVIRAIKDPVAAWGHLERLARRLQVPPELAARRMGLPVGVELRPAPARTDVRAGAGRSLSGERPRLELALASPAAARVLWEGGALEGLAEPALQEVARAVGRCLEDGVEPSPAAVSDALEDPAQAGLVAELAACRLELEPAQAVEQARRLVTELERRRLRDQRRRLRQAIAAAQAAGDLEEVARLQARRREILPSNHLTGKGEED